METERRLERERARTRIEEEKRRRRIRELEQHLAQEQRALAAANRKAYHAMKRNQYRQPPIPEEDQEDELWAATPGGKPLVLKDDGSVDPATLQQPHKQTHSNLQQDLQRSSGEISAESENAMQYIVTSTEPSPQRRAPELEQEGTLPRQAHVKRMTSWTIIGGKGIVMASTDSVESASHESSVTNHLPSSFHENDAIRNASDSDSSKTGRRRRYTSRDSGRSMSAGSSLDMPDLASINEDSVLDSIDSPPYISTGGDLGARQYPGGVPRVASATLKSEPSLRQRFERASSSGRIGIVSASGDVFMDDVSRYSLSKFHVDPSDETTEEEQFKARIAIQNCYQWEVLAIFINLLDQLFDSMRIPTRRNLMILRRLNLRTSPSIQIYIEMLNQTPRNPYHMSAENTVVAGSDGYFVDASRIVSKPYETKANVSQIVGSVKAPTSAMVIFRSNQRSLKNIRERWRN